MFRRSSILFLSAIALTAFLSLATFGQGAPVRGTVKLKKADGTVVPAAEVTVQPYRTDAKGSAPSAKTNKKGEFVFVQLTYGQTFALALSGPGIAPRIEPGIRAGREGLVIEVDEGDGRVLTEDEVRQAVAGATAAGSGEMTAEQKKAAAELEKQRALVEEKNKKIEASNAIILSSLKEGNAAFSAKDYETAIVKYSAGYDAAPDFAGSAPVLLNNRGAALRERAVARYNATVKVADVNAKIEGYKSVLSDLSMAAEGYSKSLELLKAAQPGDFSDPNAKNQQILTALAGAKDTYRLMVQTEQVDSSKLDLAKPIIAEYMAAETDAAKKESAKNILADLYRVAGDATNAIAEYRKVLATSPDDLDALAGLGLSLINAGYLENDKAVLQEGANVMQKFASAAPDNHKLKDDVLALLESLKTEQKIAPQKAPAKRGKN